MTARNTNCPTARLLLSTDTLAMLLVAGAAATMAFDIWRRFWRRCRILGALAPEGLARGFLASWVCPTAGRRAI